MEEGDVQRKENDMTNHFLFASFKKITQIINKAQKDILFYSSEKLSKRNEMQEKKFLYIFASFPEILSEKMNTIQCIWCWKNSLAFQSHDLE